MKKFIVLFFCFFYAFFYSQEFKTVAIGFNCSYFGDVKHQDPALQQIYRDQIRNIRVYEPFTNRMRPYETNVVSVLNSLVKKDFKVLFCLSNFPYYDEIMKVEEKNDVILKHRKHTNRYPPKDTANYKELLTKICDSLESNNIMKNLDFEIGNEPDAQLYFWGSKDEFFKTYRITYEIVKKYKRPIYLGGFTSTLMTNPQFGKDSYIKSINEDELLKDKNVFLSFHYYSNSHLSHEKIKNAKINNINNSIITEFNVSPKIPQGSEFEKKFNSSYYIEQLADVVKFCYNNDIKEIYCFNLMDNPKKNGVMGMFDSTGKPKIAYEMFIQFYKVIKDGFKLNTENNEDFSFIGKELTITFSENRDILKLYEEKSIFTSEIYPSSAQTKHWVIYKN